MRYGSLFAGIGGFDLGFGRAGMECAWQIEIDANCRNVLSRHWPNVRRYEDVRQCGKHNLEPVELICGGFPCQDVSVAGRRKGLAGERSGLWFEFHRIVRELAPRWVVVENVPGLLSSNGGRDFAVVLRGLVEFGYGVAWRILDAQYFGVAQRRRRVFVIGHLGDGRAAEVLFERESGAGDSPPSREKGTRIAPTLAGGFDGAGGGNRPGLNVDSAEGLIDVAYTLPASSRGTGDGHGNAWNSNYVAAPITAGYAKGSGVNDGPKGSPQNLVVAQTLGSHHGRNDLDSMGAYVTAFAWQQGDDSKHGKDGRGRSWIVRAGEYAGALSETRQDAVAGPFGVRRLTPTECERLQGFPDGWTLGGDGKDGYGGKRGSQGIAGGASDSVRYRQLGNAVAVPVAEWIGRRIVQVNGE